MPAHLAFLLFVHLPWYSTNPVEVVTHPLVIPGGVADVAGRTGYVANAQQGVSAIDLRSGAVLWESNAARRPLFVTGERLYAVSTNAIAVDVRIVALDLTHKGSVVFTSTPLSVPPVTQPNMATGRWNVTDRKITFHWEYNGETTIGTGAGFALDTSSVFVAPARPAQPALPALSRRVVRWQGEIGQNRCALLLEASAGGQVCVLQNLQTSHQRPLMEGRQLSIRVTANEQHVLVREAPPVAELPIGATPMPWTIFSLATGDKVGQLPYQAGLQAISVMEPRAYCQFVGRLSGPINRPFLQPRLLTAFDLTTGKQLWETPIEGKLTAPAGG